MPRYAGQILLVSLLLLNKNSQKKCEENNPRGNPESKSHWYPKGCFPESRQTSSENEMDVYGMSVTPPSCLSLLGSETYMLSYAGSLKEKIAWCSAVGGGFDVKPREEENGFASKGLSLRNDT